MMAVTRRLPALEKYWHYATVFEVFSTKFTHSCRCPTTDAHQMIPTQTDSFLIFGVLKRSRKVYFVSARGVSADSSNVCGGGGKARHFTAVPAGDAETYLWRDRLQAIGPVVNLGTFPDVAVGSLGLPVGQEPPRRFWKPPGAAAAAHFNNQLVFPTSAEMDVTPVPPRNDRQQQRRRDGQNQHPPLVDTVSDANTDAVSNSHIQAYNYTGEGPVFHADPLNIWRSIDTQTVTAPPGVNTSLSFAYSLKTKETMAIPARATPVKNLRVTNMMYEVEKALRTANNMDPRYDASSSGRRPYLKKNKGAF